MLLKVYSQRPSERSFAVAWQPQIYINQQKYEGGHLPKRRPLSACLLLRSYPKEELRKGFVLTVKLK
uniref:Uncharacterized protein n=1 Tax=Tupiella akineta TaxID=160070 RepID=Q6UVS6_TUPAK|nr:hypothetical protein PsakpMp36 [Tupiella akineta]AAQ18748.1 hypothetical protein [Tupiella akineta]